jgi:hypothetical protein
MKPVSTYMWGEKTDGSRGWIPWIEQEYATEPVGPLGYWAVYDKAGIKLCVCTTAHGAQRVVSRLRRATLTYESLAALPGIGALKETKAGWTFTAVGSVEDSGRTFATREEAEAYIQGCPWPSTLTHLRGPLERL